VVDLIHQAVGSLNGRRITILGLSYKANVDDLRESPEIEIALKLSNERAKVTAYEPFKPEVQFTQFKTVNSCNSKRSLKKS
jgi:UDPglucose 6-dehydrogenase